MPGWKRIFVMFALVGLCLAPTQTKASNVDAACMGDSCEMCATGGACFMNALQNCRHPACFIAGAVGGVVGAVGGGIVGPLVLYIPALALYPGVDPGVAFVGSIVVGAGCGCASVGIPAMLCGEISGQSFGGKVSIWPFAPAATGRMSPSKQRKAQ